MNLTIIGPNRGPNDDYFRVHKAGCRDIARDVLRYTAEPWTGTFDTQGEVIDCEYDFLGGPNSEDGDPTLPSERPECVSEFNFLPCCEQEEL